MKKILRRFVRPLLQQTGFDIIRHKDKSLTFPVDFDQDHIDMWHKVSPYTLTGKERVYGLMQAVKYVVKNQIEGAMVECGVWRGGSSMTIAHTLQNLGDANRDLYLYDTFAGMSAPLDVDKHYNGSTAFNRFEEAKISDEVSAWCLAPLDEVRQNLYSTGYNQERIHFVKGKVEDTMPQTLPGKIALLRLDTDFYESTKHEMIHLFPLLAPNGVLLIDDYGHWQGARKAVDEYIEENDIPILLNRIDYTGRIAIKAGKY